MGKHKSTKQAYALNFELLQYHYDRHVISHFAEVHNRTRGLSLPRALKNFADSPLDLYLNHLALTDLNIQYGKAKFLITLAPGA